MAASMDINMSDSLDDEIAQVRAEIRNLTQKRKLLTSSLLASTKVQAQLQASNNPPPPTSEHQRDHTTPLNLSDFQEHSQSNLHRLAFGVTSFPFDDPSPELQSKNPLLGIRIDIANRHGKYDSPYYMFCIRANETGPDLKVHRHTIPALVPVERYETEYLPIVAKGEVDEGYGGSDGSRSSIDQGSEKNASTQDLHGFVGKVRYDLVSWRLRQDAADWLRDELGLNHPVQPKSKKTSDPAADETSRGKRNRRLEDDAASENEDMSDAASNSDSEDEAEPIGKFGIISLKSLEVDARQIHILWSNSNVGRLKISDEGKITKAVVIGEGGIRVKVIERMLEGNGEGDLRDLLDKLKTIHERNTEADQEGKEL